MNQHSWSPEPWRCIAPITARTIAEPVASMLCQAGHSILLFGTGYDVPKCKSIRPQRLNPDVSIHLFCFWVVAFFRDASKGGEMRNHLVHADMTRLEFMMVLAGWSTTLVAVLSRFVA
jgi:hypothetical protein